MRPVRMDRSDSRVDVSHLRQRACLPTCGPSCLRLPGATRFPLEVIAEVAAERLSEAGGIGTWLK